MMGPYEDAGGCLNCLKGLYYVECLLFTSCAGICVNCNHMFSVLTEELIMHIWPMLFSNM
jgi:hypothetical protein